MIGRLTRPVFRGRRAASSALIVSGALLLIGSATSVARGAIARDAARARWAEIEAARAVAGAKLSTGGARWSEGRGTPVGRLTIPRLGLDEVVVEGVGDAELRAGPGHMIGSVLPGDSGTSVISAHRDRHFHALGGIAVGDTVVTESAHGTVVWKVTRMRVVNAEDSALEARTTPTLMLTTCWPIRYLGPAPERLIVEAVPKSSTTGDGRRATENGAAITGRH
ncbi:MAG TPA: class D sortase [Gemmatimonadaceae bacterium]|jgi:sortase A|nr:class D sortase [Gemmatimonadaceae bacterium]